VARRLRENTVVVDESGAAVPLLADSEVPDWAESQVGDHLLEAEDGSEAEDGDGPYEGVNVKTLKAEIARRNEGRDADQHIVPEGARRPELVAALVADDERIAAVQAGVTPDGGQAPEDVDESGSDDPDDE
jgi:hypothetical protein